MTLYEINQAIYDCVDMETGEVDEVKLAELELAKDDKIESILLWHKQLVAEAKAIREEELALAERRKSKEHKAESLKNYIAYALDGAKFETAKVKVAYRKSTSVEYDDDFIDWAETHGHDDLLTYKVEPSKTLIKQAIADGIDLNGKATLVEKQSMSVK